MPMKGKKEFTADEIKIIKKLIEQKLVSFTDEQKTIRAKIRNIGFYWSDFYSKSIPYNIENFEKLIENGSISVIGKATSKEALPKTKKNSTYQLPTDTNNDYKKGLAPWIGRNPRVLILGTMPSDVSIREQSYYSNKSHNSFWKIMERLFNRNRFQSDKEFITSHKISLWDCLQSGIRKGSMDQGFVKGTGKPNNLLFFLKQYPTIKTIILNGKGETVRLFNRFFAGTIECDIIELSSTSNACSIQFEQKIKEWSIIKNLVK